MEDDGTTKERGYDMEKFYFCPRGHSFPRNSRRRIHHLVPCREFAYIDACVCFEPSLYTFSNMFSGNCEHENKDFKWDQKWCKAKVKLLCEFIENMKTNRTRE